MTNRVAITGASGLIGSALVTALTQLNSNVSIITLSRGAEATDSSNCKLAWSPEKGVQQPQKLEGLDALIHLAGRPIASSRWSMREKQLLRDSRVLATQRLVSQILALKNKPKLFLSASAVGIYGNTGDQPVDESSALGNDFLSQLAIDWEQASLPLAEAGVRVIHARLGIVLTTKGGALAKMLPIFRWGLGGVLGSGRQLMSWISLDDCIDAMLLLIQNTDMCGAFNLVSPEPITNRDFTKALGKALGRPTLLPAPAWALKLILGEMADALLLSSCRALPLRLMESGYQFRDQSLESTFARLLDRTGKS